jgi:hypothetical protein
MAPYTSTERDSTARCECTTMARCGTRRAGIWLAVALASFWPAPAPAMEGMAIAPYEARYSIYRNGKLTGKMEVELLQHGDRWIIRSAGTGTYGLARILGARDTEEVRGRAPQGSFRPERYQRHTLVAGLDESWTVAFDWDDRRVSISHNDHEPLVLDMVGDSLDPLSLKLEMRRRMASENPDLRFHMVEEDEIDEQNFRALPEERIETSLGCLVTLPVEKIRHNSSRYTRAWHAPELGFIEVRMEHGKTGGNHLEMRITELTIDGHDVMPRPGCTAMQQDPPGP